MVLSALAFYLFASITVLSAIMVVTSRNPVHSVLFLILAFFNAAGLFVLQGAEFLAMLLVIVYVGAVAVLFLFVVMMLDINFLKLREGFKRYLYVGLVVGAILLIELLAVLGGWTLTQVDSAALSDPAPPINEVSNTRALGQLVYTKYVYLFQAAGLVLLVAMIGAIVLTLRSRPGVLRQSISDQVGRSQEESVEMVSVPSGQGLKR